MWWSNIPLECHYQELIATSAFWCYLPFYKKPHVFTIYLNLLWDDICCSRILGSRTLCFSLWGNTNSEVYRKSEILLNLPITGSIIMLRFPTEVRSNLLLILGIPKYLRGNYVQYDKVLLLDMLLNFQLGDWQFPSNFDPKLARENAGILLFLWSNFSKQSLNACHVRCISFIYKLQMMVALDAHFKGVTSWTQQS